MSYLKIILLITLVAISGCSRFAQKDKAAAGGTFIQFEPVTLLGGKLGYKGTISINKELQDFNMKLKLNKTTQRLELLEIELGKSTGLQAQIIQLEEETKRIIILLETVGEVLPVVASPMVGIIESLTEGD